VGKKFLVVVLFAGIGGGGVVFGFGWGCCGRLFLGLFVVWVVGVGVGMKVASVWV
jgi:hypothetical protein